jgi:hypothetical protein
VIRSPCTVIASEKLRDSIDIARYADLVFTPLMVVDDDSIR